MTHPPRCWCGCLLAALLLETALGLLATLALCLARLCGP